MNNNLWEERINFYNELKEITVEELNEMSFEAENGYVISPNKKYRVTEAIKGYKYEIEMAVRNTDGYHKKAFVLRDYLKEADGKKQSLIKDIDNYKHPNNFDWWEFNDANLQIHLIDSLISHITSIIEENLQNENKTKKHQTLVDPTNTSITLQTNLTEKNIKKLHSLLNGKYIKEIQEVDFVYWLTGKPLLNNLPKIRWPKSKGMAIDLFKSICLDFNYPSLNECVEPNGKKFDSNDVKKDGYGYAEIEEILQQVKL